MVNFKYSFSTLMSVLVFVQIMHAQEGDLNDQHPDQNTQNPEQNQQSPQQGAEQHGEGSSLDAQLGKKYILVTSDTSNFLKILKALDVRFFARMAAILAKPEIELTKSGDKYTFTSRWVFKNVVQKFKPGVPSAYVTPDGREVTSTITIEGPTLHEVQKEENGRTAFIDRTFSDKQVKSVIKVGKQIATRIYSAEQLTGNQTIKAKIRKFLMD